MLYFFLSRLDTKRHLFSPFFSSPNDIWTIFCFPFPSYLMNPIVGRKIFCKNFYVYFSPLFFFLVKFLFYFYPTCFLVSKPFFHPPPPPSLAGISRGGGGCKIQTLGKLAINFVQVRIEFKCYFCFQVQILSQTILRRRLESLGRILTYMTRRRAGASITS